MEHKNMTVLFSMIKRFLPISPEITSQYNSLSFFVGNMIENTMILFFSVFVFFRDIALYYLLFL